MHGRKIDEKGGVTSYNVVKWKTVGFKYRTPVNSCYVVI
jgi:hypothetical protein